MNSKQAVRSMLVVLLSVALLWAGDPWKEKPYTEWTEKEVAKVFQDSPWARRVTILSGEVNLAPPQPPTAPEGGAGPMAPAGETASVAGQSAASLPGQGGTSTESRQQMLFIVRWESSLTVRQAQVRQQQFEGNLNEEQAKEYLSRPPEQYLIVVYGLDMRGFEALTEDEVRAGAYLQPRQRKQKITPASVRFVRQGARLLAVEFYFSRVWEDQPVIGTEEKKVKFACRSRTDLISTDFELPKMIREGAPDL